MPKTFERNCRQCGRHYVGRGRRFCGNSCRVTWTNLHRNVAKRKDVRAKISAARLGRPTTLGMEYSENWRRNIGLALKGKKHSRKWRKAISRGVRLAGICPPRNKHLVGPRHPNWMGGHSRARGKDYNSPEYREFRLAVLSRDNWTCQDCHKRGGRLQVHHLKPWGPHPELRYSVDNAVTLCRPCHLGRHRGVPRPVTVDGRTRLEKLTAQTSV